MKLTTEIFRTILLSLFIFCPYSVLAANDILDKAVLEQQQKTDSQQLYKQALQILSIPSKNPDYNRNEFKFSTWREVYIKNGKQKEFEEATKWINEERAKKGLGCWEFCATGGFGYEEPCYILMFGHKSREEYEKANKEIKGKLKEE